MKITFKVEIEGPEKDLKDITGLEICEAIHKAIGELSIAAKEIKRDQ